MEAIKFTEIDSKTKLDEGFIYIGILKHDDHEQPDYQFLLFKNDEFSLWDEDVNQYINIDWDVQEIISVAKLSKHGSNSF